MPVPAEATPQPGERFLTLPSAPSPLGRLSVSDVKQLHWHQILKKESTTKIFVAFELCNIISVVYTTSHDYVEARSYMRFVANVGTGRRGIFSCSHDLHS